jgi:hypothetical protein
MTVNANGSTIGVVTQPTDRNKIDNAMTNGGWHRNVMPLVLLDPHNEPIFFDLNKLRNCPLCDSAVIYAGHFSALSCGIRCQRCGCSVEQQMPETMPDHVTGMLHLTGWMIARAGKMWNKRAHLKPGEDEIRLVTLAELCPQDIS